MESFTKDQSKHFKGIGPPKNTLCDTSRCPIRVAERQFGEWVVCTDTSITSALTAPKPPAISRDTHCQRDGDDANFRRMGKVQPEAPMAISRPSACLPSPQYFHPSDLNLKDEIILILLAPGFL